MEIKTLNRMVREEADKVYSLLEEYGPDESAHILTDLCAAQPRVDSRNSNSSGLREPCYLLNDENFNEFRDRVPIMTAKLCSVVESTDWLGGGTFLEACKIMG